MRQVMKRECKSCDCKFFSNRESQRVARKHVRACPEKHTLGFSIWGFLNKLERAWVDTKS